MGNNEFALKRGEKSMSKTIAVNAGSSTLKIPGVFDMPSEDVVLAEGTIERIGEKMES